VTASSRSTSNTVLPDDASSPAPISIWRSLPLPGVESNKFRITPRRAIRPAKKRNQTASLARCRAIDETSHKDGYPRWFESPASWPLDHSGHHSAGIILGISNSWKKELACYKVPTSAEQHFVDTSDLHIAHIKQTDDGLGMTHYL